MENIQIIMIFFDFHQKIFLNVMLRAKNWKLISFNSTLFQSSYFDSNQMLDFWQKKKISWTFVIIFWKWDNEAQSHNTHTKPMRLFRNCQNDNNIIRLSVTPFENFLFIFVCCRKIFLCTEKRIFHPYLLWCVCCIAASMCYIYLYDNI